MIIATVIATLGFFGAAYVTQTRGLRLGGTIVVPTLAVNALRDFLTIPIFVASTVLGYYFLGLAKERTLIYGRDEFVVGLLDVGQPVMFMANTVDPFMRALVSAVEQRAADGGLSLSKY